MFRFLIAGGIAVFTFGPPAASAELPISGPHCRYYDGQIAFRITGDRYIDEIDPRYSCTFDHVERDVDGYHVEMTCGPKKYQEDMWAYLGDDGPFVVLNDGHEYDIEPCE